MATTGEELHVKGEEGAIRAKRWLDSTCRADALWNNPKKGKSKLQYSKAAGDGTFSFDLGGRMLGPDTSDEMFLAEVKNYKDPGDQGAEYRKFLSKCYRVEVLHGKFFDHYMWITWAPFLVTSWSKLTTPEFVHQTIESCAFGKEAALDGGAAAPEITRAVSEKLMIVVLSERQEDRLTLQGDELFAVRSSLIEVRDGQ